MARIDKWHEFPRLKKVFVRFANSYHRDKQWHEYQEADAMKDDKVIYRELSYLIMKAVFEVHNALGPGFIESVYEKALVYELELRGIPFERQKVVTVSYKGRVVGTHRLDLVVDGKIVLELKAGSALTNVFKQQTLSYLKATGLRLGIISNFGTPRVEYTRIVN